MVDAHIIAKTTLPDLSRVIARPRLMRQVDDAGALRVIQITGQAAQGKSTLAAEIMRRPGPAAVWMHLNPSDRDPANLFNLLVQALDNLDLAFTSDEIFHFFADLYGQPLAPPQLARLQDITDGWVGGLVLIREALRHVPQDQWPAYIDNGLPAALQGERLAYFSETVFAGLDEQTSWFLIRSAIFDTVHPKRTAHYFVSQPENVAESILARMVRENQFIHCRYDPQSGWGYHSITPWPCACAHSTTTIRATSTGPGCGPCRPQRQSKTAWANASTCIAAA